MSCEIDIVAGMYHAADVDLAQVAPSMRAFRGRMLTRLGQAIGGPSPISLG